MGFLRNLRFLLILGLAVITQAHVIRRRDVGEKVENAQKLSDDLRTPQKYIIEPVQTLLKESDSFVLPPAYDSVDFGTEDKFNEIDGKIEEENRNEYDLRSGDLKDEAKETEANNLKKNADGKGLSSSLPTEVANSKPTPNEVASRDSEKLLNENIADIKPATKEEVSTDSEKIVGKNLANLAETIEDEETSSDLAEHNADSRAATGDETTSDREKTLTENLADPKPAADEETTTDADKILGKNLVDLAETADEDVTKTITNEEITSDLGKTLEGNIADSKPAADKETSGGSDKSLTENVADSKPNINDETTSYSEKIVDKNLVNLALSTEEVDSKPVTDDETSLSSPAANEASKASEAYKSVEDSNAKDKVKAEETPANIFQTRMVSGVETDNIADDSNISKTEGDSAVETDIAEVKAPIYVLNGSIKDNSNTNKTEGNNRVATDMAEVKVKAPIYVLNEEESTPTDIAEVKVKAPIYVLNGSSKEDSNTNKTEGNNREATDMAEVMVKAPIYVLNGSSNAEESTPTDIAEVKVKAPIYVLNGSSKEDSNTNKTEGNNRVVTNIAEVKVKAPIYVLNGSSNEEESTPSDGGNETPTAIVEASPNAKEDTSALRNMIADTVAETVEEIAQASNTDAIAQIPLESLNEADEKSKSGIPSVSKETLEGSPKNAITKELIHDIEATPNSLDTAQIPSESVNETAEKNIVASSNPEISSENKESFEGSPKSPLTAEQIHEIEVTPISPETPSEDISQSQGKVSEIAEGTSDKVTGSSIAQNDEITPKIPNEVEENFKSSKPDDNSAIPAAKSVITPAEPSKEEATSGTLNVSSKPVEITPEIPTEVKEINEIAKPEDSVAIPAVKSVLNPAESAKEETSSDALNGSSKPQNVANEKEVSSIAELVPLDLVSLGTANSAATPVIHSQETPTETDPLVSVETETKPDEISTENKVPNTEKVPLVTVNTEEGSESKPVITPLNTVSVLAEPTASTESKPVPTSLDTSSVVVKPEDIKILPPIVIETKPDQKQNPVQITNQKVPTPTSNIPNDLNAPSSQQSSAKPPSAIETKPDQEQKPVQITNQKVPTPVSNTPNELNAPGAQQASAKPAQAPRPTPQLSNKKPSTAVNTKPVTQKPVTQKPVRYTPKPTTKPSKVTAEKPVRVVYIKTTTTAKPNRSNTAPPPTTRKPPATPPTRKSSRKPTSAPSAPISSTPNLNNKAKPSNSGAAQSPVTSRPITNLAPPTQKPGQQSWFPNFYQAPSFPAFFINPFNTSTITSNRNRTESTYGVGLLAVPWNWRPNLNFFSPNRVIETPPPKSDVQKQEVLGRDLAFWNALFHRNLNNTTANTVKQANAAKNTTQKKETTGFFKPWNNTKIHFNAMPITDFFKLLTSDESAQSESSAATIPSNTQVLHLYLPLRFPFQGKFVQTRAMQQVAPLPTKIDGKVDIIENEEENIKLRSPLKPEDDEVPASEKKDADGIKETERKIEATVDAEKTPSGEDKSSLLFELEMPKPVVQFVNTMMAFMPTTK